MKELIKTYLCDIIRNLTPNFGGDILVDILANKERGDYSTNVAFALSKILKKKPQDVALELAEKISGQNLNEFSKIEAENGFVNFTLSKEFLYGELNEILNQKEKYGRNKYRHPMSIFKVHMDFVSANPTGPLTMGNGRGGFYGDALANALETQGYKVWREYYINDRGEQISALGKSIKAAQKGLSISEIDKSFYKGGYISDFAEKMNKNLNESEIGQKAAELIIETYIKPAIKKAGIKFDNWFSEKSLYVKKGDYEKIMNTFIQADLIYEKDGATWLKTTKFGDDEDRVLIKKNGEETYFMSDILYHIDKLKIRKFDKAINIWGADHHGYAPRLKAALKALGISEDKLMIIISQLIRLVKNGKEVKISKRAGNFITLEELINEVGLDAARFFFLTYSPNTHMDFDIALAKERSQKNPVYYIQYAHARIASILAKLKYPPFVKASGDKQNSNLKITTKNLKLLKTNEELNLIRKLVEYPEILAEIAQNYEVHRLPRYALELAREFHNFYEKQRVITEDENLTSARLPLIFAVRIVLANILRLIGITAPDKM